MYFVKQVTPIDVIRGLLKRLDYAGNDPTNQTTRKKIFSCTILVLILAMNILCLISIFVSNYESVGLLIVDIIVVGGLSQVLSAKHKCLL